MRESVTKGYPKPCDIPGFDGDPYTMGMQLCDDDGIVRAGAMHKGVDYECTAHAHFAGEHIECLSPAHEIIDCPRCHGTGIGSVTMSVGLGSPHRCELCLGVKRVTRRYAAVYGKEGNAA